MASVYKSICFEADTLLVHITNLAEKEIRYKVEIEKLMNKGFVNIAKARYIMGSSCVTKMQLPTGNSNPIKPLATVCRAQSNNHWIFHIHRRDNGSKNELNDDESVTDFANEYIQNGGENVNNGKRNSLMSSEIAFKNLLQNDPKALKRSKDAFNVKDSLYKDYNEELLDEMSTDSDSSGSLVSITDPIRLFGVLVPNTLKQAQMVFKDVVNLLGKCATLQSELREALHRYNHLETVKKLIEAAAIEMKMDISKPKVYWTPSETSTITCHTIINSVEDEGGEEEDNGGGISVKKSIRSVFYDFNEVEPQEPQEIELIWSNEETESGLEEN